MLIKKCYSFARIIGKLNKNLTRSTLIKMDEKKELS